MKHKVRTIDIQAKEWFDRINGNSYFAANITVNYGLPGECFFTLPFQYGYGDQYRYESFKLLIEKKIIKHAKPGYFQALQYCRDNNIIVRTSKETGCKKSELKNI